MIDYSIWKEYEGASEGSGRSDKVWLINEEGKIGLFKFTKTDSTKEHISEKLASNIAKLIELECAYIDIGFYDNRAGCMSYLINDNDDILIEGISIINREYPFYNPETLYDSKEQEFYSLEMIEKSLIDYNLINDFIKVMIYDFIIGNTDRHQSNWALLQNSDQIKLCPLYDNGSSLCCYIDEKDIGFYLGKDQMRFQSLVNTKSKSRIRIDKKNKKEPTHLEVITHLKNYYNNEELNKWITNIINILNLSQIRKILSSYDEDLLSKQRKQLIERFLNAKLNYLKDVFMGKEDEHVG